MNMVTGSEQAVLTQDQLVRAAALRVAASELELRVDLRQRWSQETGIPVSWSGNEAYQKAIECQGEIRTLVGEKSFPSVVTESVGAGLVKPEVGKTLISIWNTGLVAPDAVYRVESELPPGILGVQPEMTSDPSLDIGMQVYREREKLKEKGI
jgi:hypothetical protein